MSCKQDHRYTESFKALPDDQGGVGRHKCAGCAYDIGFKAGEKKDSTVSIDLDSLPDSQAGTVRHKSPYAAFDQGYLDGVNSVI